MAVKKSSGRSGARRSPHPRPDILEGLESSQALPSASPLTGAEAVIETERRRLMAARSILRCVSCTLNQRREAGYQEIDLDDGDFADAIDSTQQMIDLAIRNLDLVHLEKAKWS